MADTKRRPSKPALALSSLFTPPSSPQTRILQLQKDVEPNSLLSPPITPPRADARRTSVCTSSPDTPRQSLSASALLCVFRDTEPAALDVSNLQLGDSIASGQWSNVRAAGLPDQPAAFAIKKARGKMAEKVLAHEAKVLAYVSSFSTAANVVAFKGIDSASKSLVLGLAPVTLERHVEALENSGRCLHSDISSHRLEQGLVAGLLFLHAECNIIHGDIKPSNILLRHAEPGYLQPLYCDFSASRFDDPLCRPNESAGTYEYMAPELFTFKEDQGWISKASDVFALGVTLLFAIVGQAPYREAAGSWRSKMALARNGDPLASILASPELERRFLKAQCKLVERAVSKKQERRPTAGQWMEHLLQLQPARVRRLS